MDVELSANMRSFIKTVDEYSREWEGTGYGWTWEFSTSGEELEAKLLYLMEKSHQVKRGHWSLTYCSTCEGYNPETPYHVDLHVSLDYEEVFEMQRNDYFIGREMVKLKKEMHGMEMSPVGMIQSLVDTIENTSGEPEVYDSYVAATLHLDTLAGKVGALSKS